MSKNRPDFYEAVLTEMKRALDENKITQTEVGQALGIKQSAVSSLLNGKSKLTLEQFLTVSDLLAIKPHQLLSSAEVVLTQTVPMPYEVEAVLYKSEAHLVAYCSATQEVSLDDLVTEDYPKDKMKLALEELLAVGVLTKKRERYVQSNPNVTYTPSSRLRASQCHQKIMVKAWTMWERLREKPSFRLRRFNYYYLDRFTVGQVKEIEAILWRAYEKLQTFQRENLAKGYHSDDPMPLWNIHMMLSTPLEQK